MPPRREAPENGRRGCGKIVAGNTMHRTSPGHIAAPPVSGTGDGSAPDDFFRTLLDAAPDAMIVVAADGRIVLVNAVAQAMFGYTREEMLGLDIEALIPERLRATHRGHREVYGRAPKLRAMGIGMELLAVRRDGTEFPVEVSLSPIDSPSGPLVVSAIRDVTERKRIQQELEAARHAAERANKANTAFLSAASHDLRQPVQALRLLNGALRRTVTDPLALEMIESQQESLDAMTNLLNSLLDISRLDAGAFHPNVEEFPLQTLIGRLAAEFSRQARHKGLDFHAEPCSVIVRSDPDLLGEIIQNFVSNAVRYTREGSVRLSCTRDGNHVSIDVSDTGVGIPAEELDRIFDEFHQVQRGERKKEGVGLGLAIARRVADLLGHTLSVRSTVGEGSCFSVRVPLAGQAAAREPAAVEAPERPRAATGFVLIVEDDVQVAKAWNRLLQAEGYRVAQAESVAGLRDLLKTLEGTPDLVISDYHLPGGANGIDAVRLIREAAGRCIPAFIVTGDTSKVVHQVARIENSRILSKPIGPDELLRLAHAAIEEGLEDRA